MVLFLTLLGVIFNTDGVYFDIDWTCLLVAYIYMSELEKASLRIFGIIMIGLGFILWLQLQGCTPPPPPPIEYEYVPMDSTLA